MQQRSPIRHLLLASLAALVQLVVIAPAHAAWRESDESIKSRGEVSVHALVSQALPADTKDAGIKVPDARHIVIFFPGADGTIRTSRSGVSMHGKRPSTLGLLAEQIDMAVAMGLPGDQARGISLEWRAGNAHLTDALAVVTHFAGRYPSARISLVGLSAGGFTVTRVAAAIAKRGTPALNAVAVLSSAPRAIEAEVMSPLTAAKVPVLVMHHRRDSCLAFADMEKAAKPYTFVAIDDENAPSTKIGTRDCNPGSAHVFAGKERETYTQLADWLKRVAVK